MEKKSLETLLEKMVLIRVLERRAEAAYQQGKIGGFFHSYQGQEAIATAAVEVCGPSQWYIATYRCHAIALLLGVSPKALLAELYGRETGNVSGRGGSMHLYTSHLLGGFGIVGGHVPIAIGAAFSAKYLEQKDRLAVCFLGEGAVAQGAVHESLNLAALWELPLLLIIENNLWGMGTAKNRALAIDKIAEGLAPTYGLKGYTVDGTNLLSCLDLFAKAKREVLETGRPVLVEAVAERFRGHSISDPGLYRTRESVKDLTKHHDPILLAKETIGVSDERLAEMEEKARQQTIEAMQFAEESPWPNPTVLEKGVYADG